MATPNERPTTEAVTRQISEIMREAEAELLDASPRTRRPTRRGRRSTSS